MPENLITDGGSRVREAARTLVKEYCRKHDERIMSETTVSTYDGITRQALLTPWGKSLFRRSKDYGEKATENTGVHPQEIEVPWLSGLRIRLVPGAPYYIK